MKLLLSLLLSFLCIVINAQQIQKKIINTAGATYNASGTTLRVSVGEPIVGNLGNPSTTLSQGFLTGFSRLIIIDPPTQPIPPGYSIYPNPVKNILYIRGDLSVVKDIHFFDITGRRLFAQRITAGGIVQIQHLPAGYYIAKLTGRSDETLNVFKIIKLNE